MMVNCSELWGRSGAIYQLASQSLSICMCHRKGRTTFAAQGKLAMAVFFVALKRARMPGWLQGKKQVWSAPGSLMMKVHRFDLAHPWNRHNWTYIPFPDTPIHIYIYNCIYYICIYIYYCVFFGIFFIWGLIDRLIGRICRLWEARKISSVLKLIVNFKGEWIILHRSNSSFIAQECLANFKTSTSAARTTVVLQTFQAAASQLHFVCSMLLYHANSIQMKTSQMRWYWTWHAPRFPACEIIHSWCGF